MDGLPEIDLLLARPRVKTEYPKDLLNGLHPVVVLTLEAGATPLTLCGDSWCEGQCNLPAGVIPDEVNGELKMHSSMTACGPVMQRFRVLWKGTKFEIPDQFRSDLLKQYWW